MTIDYILAGDLKGNMWQFDVRSATPGEWRSTYLDTSSNPVPLFVAKDAANTPQPITSRPEVGKHPENRAGFVVYFGTGKYLELADNDPALSTGTQTFYGVWANPANTTTISGRSVMLQQTVTHTASVHGQTVRITSDNAINWDNKSGWYLDLPGTGEKQVSDAVLRDHRIIFTTLIPNQQICSFGGTSFLMELDVRGGRRLEFPPFDLNDDGQFTDADDATVPGYTGKVHVSGVGSAEGILPSPTVLVSGNTEIKYNSGSTGGIKRTTNNRGPNPDGRLVWRQLFQP